MFFQNNNLANYQRQANNLLPLVTDSRCHWQLFIHAAVAVSSSLKNTFKKIFPSVQPCKKETEIKGAIVKEEENASFQCEGKTGFHSMGGYWLLRRKEKHSSSCSPLWRTRNAAVLRCHSVSLMTSSVWYKYATPPSASINFSIVPLCCFCLPACSSLQAPPVFHKGKRATMMNYICATWLMLADDSIVFYWLWHFGNLVSPSPLKKKQERMKLVFFQGAFILQASWLETWDVTFALIISDCYYNAIKVHSAVFLICPKSQLRISLCNMSGTHGPMLA